MPVLSEGTVAAHSTMVVPTPVRPSGDTGAAHALPIDDVGLFGMRDKDWSEVHVIDSPASVDSASPVTSPQPVARLPTASNTLISIN